MPRNKDKGKQSSHKNGEEAEFSLDKIQFFSKQEEKISAALIAADHELKCVFFPGRIFLSAAPSMMLQIGEGLYDSNKQPPITSYILVMMAIGFFLYERDNTPSIDMPEKIGAILQQFLENDLIDQEDILSIDILQYQDPDSKFTSFITVPVLTLIFLSTYIFILIKALGDYIKDETASMPKVQGFVAIMASIYLCIVGMKGWHRLQNDMQQCLSAQQDEVVQKLNDLVSVIGAEKTEIILGKDEKKLFGYVTLFLNEKSEFSYSANKMHHRNPLDAHDVHKEILFVLRLLGIYGYEIEEEGRNGVKLIGAIGPKKSALNIAKAMGILRERLIFRENIKFYYDRDPEFSTLKDRLNQATHTRWYVSKVNREDKGMLCLSTISLSEGLKTIFIKMAQDCPSLILEEDYNDKTYNIYCVDIANFSAQMHSYLQVKRKDQMKKGSISIFAPLDECDIPYKRPISEKRAKKHLGVASNTAESSRIAAEGLSERREVKRLHTSLRFIGLEKMQNDMRDPIAFKKATNILASGTVLAPNAQSQQGLKCTLDKERMRVKMKGYGGGLRPLFIFNPQKSKQPDEKVYEYKGLMHK